MKSCLFLVPFLSFVAILSANAYILFRFMKLVDDQVGQRFEVVTNNESLRASPSPAPSTIEESTEEWLIIESWPIQATGSNVLIETELSKLTSELLRGIDDSSNKNPIYTKFYNPDILFY